MLFVNREDAVRELMEIHRGNYNRAVDQSGECFHIPLCDHVVGLGKSEFGRNYIRKCQEGLCHKSPKSRFEENLYKCQTIQVTLPQGSLINDQTADQVVMEALKRKIKEDFVTSPSCLASSFQSSDLMLQDLTEEVGTVFVVLDEMGAAFESTTDKSDLVCRQKFLRFCDEILGRWLLCRNVFFLVLGRASFFGYVGQRPEIAVSVPPSKSHFRRLPLRLLKVSAIKLILNNTLLEEHSTKTVAEYYNLETSQIEEVATYLFTQTNGHPRQLLRALKTCRSYDDLITYMPEVEIEHWELFCKRVISNKTSVLELLRNVLDGTERDMTRRKTVQGKLISFDEIASSCLMAWDGTIDNATIYALPWVITFLKSLVMPFDNFLKDLNQRSGSLPLDYPDVFELLVMKRFQQLFSSEGTPKDVLEPFFNTAKFGGFSRVSLSGDHIAFPKITRRGQRSPSMASCTADPDAWPQLLKEIDAHESICLKPAPQSSSPDIIFASNAWLNTQKLRLRICIAAKNYLASELTEMGIDAEIQKANRMFTSPCESDQTAVNILFICSTNYGTSVKDRFSGAKFYQYAHENIDEIIVMDLTTPENRAIFFGLSRESSMSATIEAVIKKVSMQ